jgi:Leucine-rich repeat (LRR) protein
MPAKVKKANEILDLAGKRRRTLDDLPADPSIKALALYASGLESLAGIATKFPSLRVLNIDGCKVTNLAPLAKLGKLEYLGAARNKLRSLRGLPRSLTAIRASGNKIASLADLAGLTKLEELDLGKNAIAKLDGLGKLRALAKLSLSGNPIRRLENLERLAELRELSIDGEKITSVSPATARWLEAQDRSFDFHTDPAVRRTNVAQFLVSRSRV